MQQLIGDFIIYKTQCYNREIYHIQTAMASLWTSVLVTRTYESCAKQTELSSIVRHNLSKSTKFVDTTMIYTFHRCIV
jgi:hypothetical protein